MTLTGTSLNLDFSQIDWSSPYGVSNPISTPSSVVFPQKTAETTTSQSAPQAESVKACEKAINKNTVAFAKDLINEINTKKLTSEQKNLLKELLDEYISQDAPRLTEKDALS